MLHRLAHHPIIRSIPAEEERVKQAVKEAEERAAAAQAEAEREAERQRNHQHCPTTRACH